MSNRNRPKHAEEIFGPTLIVGLGLLFVLATLIPA
jgi:hypothetical protein